jgi:hypothetical protein
MEAIVMGKTSKEMSNCWEERAARRGNVKKLKSSRNK